MVRSEKTGRVRTYQVAPKPLQATESWMVAQREIWETRFDQLDSYLKKMKGKNHDALESSIRSQA